MHDRMPRRSSFALPNDVPAAVGNTPLIRLKKASEATGCTILGKAEFMNPGQSVKDRAALFIIRDAIAAGRTETRRHHRRRHGRQHRHRPRRRRQRDGLSHRHRHSRDAEPGEEGHARRLLGAELVEVPAVPYKNPNNYVKYSRPPRRGPGEDRAERRDLGEPVRQRRQPRGAHRDDGAGDLGADRRQGRRLRLGGRLGRHARRRVAMGLKREEPGTSRSRLPTRRAPRCTATTRRAS